MNSIRLSVVLSLVSVAWFSGAQDHSCPDEPTQSAVPCSVHQSWTWSDYSSSHDPAYHLRKTYKDAQGGNHHRWHIEAIDVPRIEIRVYDAMAQYDDHRWVADVLAKTLMQFPRLLLRALPERLVIAVNQNGPVFYIGPSWDRGAWWVEFPAVYFDGYRESVDAAMEELLVHELAHVLDHLHNLRNDAGWISESEKDESEVSDYAESNEAEALAETMLAWLALETDNAKYQPELRDVHSDTSAIEQSTAARGSRTGCTQPPLARREGYCRMCRCAASFATVKCAE